MSILEQKLDLSSLFEPLIVPIEEKDRPSISKIDCEHMPLEATDTQRTNLLTLADYLMGLPEDYRKFEMGFIHSKEASVLPSADRAIITEECGSVACAVGHGPSAGVEALPIESWSEYWRRAFCDPGQIGSDFMFGGHWSVVDNTPHGAAARIYYVLDHGVPRRGSRGLYEEKREWKRHLNRELGK